jgi:hypothetical protein
LFTNWRTRACFSRASSESSRTEDLAVEVVPAEQQLVDAAQELAALRSLDHAMVVGARERDDLRDAELRERLGIGALVLDRVRDGADADDRGLPRDQPRNGHRRPDGAGVGDRDGRSGEVVGRQLVRADLADQLFVRRVEPGEVETVRRLDRRDEQCA